jgi:hypothetical protein
VIGACAHWPRTLAVAAAVCPRHASAYRPPLLGLMLLTMFTPGVVGLRPAGPQPRAPRCEPVSDHGRIPVGARIDTGQYTLTVVASTGPSEGASARGNLWLVSMAAVHDSAVAAGTSDPIRVSPDVPLYGATDVDLAGVSAPVQDGGAAPSAHSLDPSRPGVVVRYRVDSTSGSADVRLYVATTRNDRRGCDRRGACPDPEPGGGPGVVFDVHKLDEAGFAGAWQPVASGAAHGYFCAVPVRYYSRYKSRNLAQPPKPH